MLKIWITQINIEFIDQELELEFADEEQQDQVDLFGFGNNDDSIKKQ